MNTIILKLKRRIKKLKLKADGYMGSGLCASDYDQISKLYAEIKGLRTAIRVIRGA